MDFLSDKDDCMSESPESTNNQQIADYLNFYLNLPRPGYAVFLNGQWGSGKTWFIKNFRESNNSQKYLHITLYGVSSVAEIEDQFFQQLHPLLSSKAFTIGAKLLKSAIKASVKLDVEGEEVGVDVKVPSLDVQKFLTDSENCVLIFDDLERCKNIHEILGYINHFVEHQEQKVIVIGNEEEILKKYPDFKEKKEKLIGRTFTIQAEFEEALTTFINAIGDLNIKKILIQNTNLIQNVFKNEKYHNLRTLKHCIFEYERFYRLLPKEAQENQEFQKSLVNSLFSLCLGIRSGQLQAKDILGMHVWPYDSAARRKFKKEEKEEPNPLAEFYERRFSSLSEEISPNEEAMYCFFEYGVAPKHTIENAISGNKYFLKENTPTWIKLWNYFSLTDEEFPRYFKEVLTKFSNFEFTKLGEFRHVAGILLGIAKKNLADFSYDEASQLIESTINHMCEKNLIILPDEKDDIGIRFNDVYAGLQFMELNDPCFKKATERLNQYKRQKTEEYIKKCAAELIDIIKKDVSEFLRMMTFSNAMDKEFYNVPILHHVPASDFVTAIIEMNPAPHGRASIGQTFMSRYKFLEHYPDLLQELDWLKEVITQIENKEPSLKQPTKYQLGQIKELVTKAVNTLETFANRSAVPEQNQKTA